jgi:hypothetical protein
MSMSNIEIIFGVSNDYLHILKPACSLFNEFWSSKKHVKIAGFDAPDFDMPDNFSFASLGNQRGPKYWTEDILQICDLVEGDYFIFVVENDFLIRPVNFEILHVFEKMLQADKSIARIDLTTSSSVHSMGTIVKSYPSFDIFELPQSADWRMALGHYSIWNKQYLRSFLKRYPQTTPWEFEALSCQNAKNDGAKILASSRDYAVHFIDSIHQHQGKNVVDLTGIGGRSSFGLSIDEKIIEKMISENVVRKNGSFYNVIL